MTTRTHHSIPPVLPPPNCFTVLVVDDMLPNRILLRKVLQNAGYAVLEAEDGAEALDYLRTCPKNPDLIVTDIEMPEMDGITFIGEVRRMEGCCSGIPIIAASGNADDQMSREAVSAGSDVFMVKPFDLPQLRKEMADLLRSRKRTASERVAGNLARDRNQIDFRARELRQG